jgi:hypothetical protein
MGLLLLSAVTIPSGSRGHEILAGSSRFPCSPLSDGIDTAEGTTSFIFAFAFLRGSVVQRSSLCFCLFPSFRGK